MTTVANSGLGTAESLFKKGVWDQIVNAGIAAIIVEVPILAEPGLEQVTSMAVHWLADKLYEDLRLVLDLSVIKFVNNEHQSTFENSVTDLQIISDEKGATSYEYLQAQATALDALSDFARFGS